MTGIQYDPNEPVHPHLAVTMIADNVRLLEAYAGAGYALRTLVLAPDRKDFESDEEWKAAFVRIPVTSLDGVHYDPVVNN